MCSGCAIERVASPERPKSLTEIISRLRPGQTINQVRDLAPDMNNCTGNQIAVYSCEAKFLIPSSRSPASITTDPSANAHFENFRLIFEGGNLVHWDQNL